MTVRTEDEDQIVRQARRIRRERGERRRREMRRKYASAPSVPPRWGDRYDVRPDNVRSLRWVKDRSVDCVITDPPYPREFLHVYGDLARTAARVLRPGGNCLVMCGQAYLPEVVDLLREHMDYRWTLACMTPGESSPIVGREVLPRWKPVLWFRKGRGRLDRMLVGDVVSSRNSDERRHHHWEQSEGDFAYLITRFTRPGDLVFDPFMGGGTTAVVALRMGRRFAGCDSQQWAVNATLHRLRAEVDRRADIRSRWRARPPDEEA